MVLKEVRCDVVDWIHVDKDRILLRAVVSTEMKLPII